MSLFAKTGPWVVASMMAAAAVFGQNSKCAPSQKSFDHGQDMMQSQMMAGYNASARTEVRGSWDIYAMGAFTYWQAVQDNMELGIVSDSVSPVAGLTVQTNGHAVNNHFGYKPGFKVALGMNFDHDQWDSMVEYTWFRGSSTTETNLDSVTNPATTLFPARVEPTGSSSFYKGVQDWKVHMDVLDWQLARSYYVGTKLTFRPIFAARALWLRQRNDVQYTVPQASNSAGFQSVNGVQKAQSWAVGPRFGIGTNWMIGEGFRFFGNGGADILFTQYTKLSETQISTLNYHHVDQHKLNTVRTHLDAEFGIAWGSYFDNNNWHIDLMAGYGFQVFFDQNMFRQFLSGTSTNLGNSISPNGNLYMHGLTASARFDF